MSFRINIPSGSPVSTTTGVPTEKSVVQKNHVYVPPKKTDFKYKPNPIDSYLPTSTNVNVGSQPTLSQSEKEIIVYDKTTKEWKLVKESESYRYNF